TSGGSAGVGSVSRVSENRGVRACLETRQPCDAIDQQTMSSDLGSGASHETTLGGEHVLIREGHPQDVPLYREVLRAVSADDLRLRFFARVAELSAAEIAKLSQADHKHEMAFVALDENTGQMLGLVRLRDELDETTAEFAILIRSRLKGHGLGWLL